MSIRNQLTCSACAALLLALTATESGAQSMTAHHRQPEMAQQPAAASTFSVGEAIEIRDANGNWVKGTVTNIDAASGKYQVSLENSVSGWAPANLLRRASGSNGPAALSPAATRYVSAPAPAGGGCGQAGCVDLPDFAAAVTDFRVTTSGSYRLADVTIHFTNKTAQPLTIGYVDESGAMLDDQGNRLRLNGGALRGMGLIRGNSLDGKFVLQSGQGGDAQFEFVLPISASQIFGTGFEVNMTLRELNPAGAAGQYTLGPEYPIHFLGLTQTQISAGAALPAPAQLQSLAGPAAVAPAAVGPAVQTAPALGSNAPAAQSATNAKRSSFFGGLSKAAGMLPGLSGVAGGKVGSTISNVQNVFPGLSADPNQGGATGGVSGVISRASALFPGLTGNPQTAAVPGAAATVSPTAPPQSAVGQQPGSPALMSNLLAPRLQSPVAATNGCAGRPSCFNAGTFTAEAAGVNGRGNTLRVTVQFHNASAQPVTLAYVPGSAMASDNQDNRYQPAISGKYDSSISGMGSLQGQQANAGFVLNPGQTRAASFTLTRPANATTAMGSVFTLNAAVMELDTSTGQIRPGRQDRLTLANVACPACAGPAPVARNAANVARPPAANAAAKPTTPANAAKNTAASSLQSLLGKKK